MAKYEVLVYSKDGLPMANIFSLCKNFNWQKVRNDAGSVSFDLNLEQYESYLEEIGFGDDPFAFLETGRNDIRIKRNGQWLHGVNVIKFDYSNDETDVMMKVQCTGYLNFYKKQYVDIDFDDTPQEDIIWGAIEACNAKTGGDYGITQGTHVGASILRSRHQVRKEVKSFIQQMTQVIGGVDVEITADKKLNTFIAQGAYRPDVRLAYPGNISGFNFSRSVESVANFIYGVGSGNGEDAVQAESEDVDSETYLYRREQIASYNSVVEEGTLQQNIDALKHYTSMPIELPTITVQPNTLDLSTVGIGDTIPIALTGNKSLAHINGYYRIESISCAVNDQGDEMVDLTFDDIDISEIIALQEGA